jgi:diguanylate cyclase (GGDEF)-like protein
VALRAELVRLRRELADAWYAADHDSLTGLLNRRGFYERAAQALACPDGRPVSVMLLDLDGFKLVNDAYGHRVGDRVLVAVTARLVAHLYDGWLCARLGGDEFAVLRAGVDTGQSLVARAAVLAEVLAAPVRVDRQRVEVGAAVGMVSATTPVSLGVLLGRADAAMYRAKHAGRPVVWDPARDDDSGPGGRPLLRTRDLPGPRAPEPPVRVAEGSPYEPAGVS